MGEREFDFSLYDQELLSSLKNEGALPESCDTDELVEQGTLVGNFRLKAFLGSGGGGKVYMGEHPEIGKRVAIKLLPSHSTSGMWQRFLREAKLLGGLHNPHIVDLYDFGYDQKLGYYMIMELLDGETVQQRLRRNPLSPYAAVTVTWHVLEALSAAHQVGIIHRDLKPSNFFLARWGKRSIVKLLDFGAAKQKPSEPTQTSSSMISARWYMSPEQQSGRSLTARSDLYSIGVVLYEMISGRDPSHLSEAGHPGSLMPPSRVIAGVSKELEALILRCSAPNPALRPESAVVLQEELRAILPLLAKTPYVTPVSAMTPTPAVSLVARRSIALEQVLLTIHELS